MLQNTALLKENEKDIERVIKVVPANVFQWIYRRHRSSGSPPDLLKSKLNIMQMNTGSRKFKQVLKPHLVLKPHKGFVPALQAVYPAK